MIPLDTGQRFLKMKNNIKEILIKFDAASDEDGKAFAEKVIAETKKKTFKIIEAAYWKDRNETYAMIEVADKVIMICIFLFTSGLFSCN